MILLQTTKDFAIPEIWIVKIIDYQVRICVALFVEARLWIRCESDILCWITWIEHV